MVHKDSWPCTKRPLTSTCSEWDNSTPHPHNYLFYSHLILFSHLRLRLLSGHFPVLASQLPQSCIATCLARPIIFGRSPKLSEKGTYTLSHAINLILQVNVLRAWISCTGQMGSTNVRLVRPRLWQLAVCNKSSSSWTYIIDNVTFTAHQIAI